MDFFQGVEPHEIDALTQEIRGARAETRGSKLTPEKAQGLVWKGFELSQGNNQLLRDMWLWVHYHYPHYKISQDAVSQIEDNLQRPVVKLLVPGPDNPGIHVSSSSNIGQIYTDDSAISAMRKNIQRFADILNDNNPISPQDTNYDLERDIFLQQIQRDFRNLIEGAGRPGNPAKKDIWDSNICKFVFSSNPASTGYKEFDAMWSEVRNAVTPEFLQKMQNSRAALAAVINVYNQHHPDNQVSNPLSI